MRVPPGDNAAHRFPVSVKGVILLDGKVVLLGNERNEWELPGGKLEVGEAPEDCLAREIEEELGLRATVEGLVDCWVYAITPEVEVLIVTYGCRVAPDGRPRISGEHKAFGLFDPSDLSGLNLPRGYARSIQRWRRGA